MFCSDKYYVVCTSARSDSVILKDINFSLTDFTYLLPICFYHTCREVHRLKPRCVDPCISWPYTSSPIPPQDPSRPVGSGVLGVLSLANGIEPQIAITVSKNFVISDIAYAQQIRFKIWSVDH
jgi:hypothetical protein